MAKTVKQVKYTERSDYFPKEIYEKYFAENEVEEKKKEEEKKKKSEKKK